MKRTTSLPARKKNTRLQGAFAGDRLYRDLKDHVLDSPAHQVLAPERTLARDYDIACGTVRRVLEQLVREKLIYKAQGRGTFVAPRDEGEGGRRNRILYVDNWANQEHPYVIRKLQGVLDAAAESDYRIQVCREPAFDLWEQGDLPFLADAAQPSVLGVLLPYLPEPLYHRLKRLNPSLRIVSCQAGKDHPDVTAVFMDPAAFGHLAASHLADRGVCSVLAVCKRPETRRALETRLAETGRAIAFTNLPWEHSLSAQAVTHCILEHRPEGLFIADDRLTMAVLVDLARVAPGMLDSLVILSSANAGEELLPPGVVRIVGDAYEVGRTAVHALKAMEERNPLVRGCIRLEPELVISRNAEPGPQPVSGTQTPNCAR